MKYLNRTEEEKKQLAAEMCEYLNDLIATDREAIHRLVESRQECNQALHDHPTVQVSTPTPDGPVVGMLGILNGFIGVDDQSMGYLIGCFDDATGELIRFVPRDDPSLPSFTVSKT